MTGHDLAVPFGGGGRAVLRNFPDPTMFLHRLFPPMVPLMKAVDRVMLAYERTRPMSDEQNQMVRENLTVFIEELRAGNLPEQSPKTPVATSN